MKVISDIQSWINAQPARSVTSRPPKRPQIATFEDVLGRIAVGWLDPWNQMNADGDGRAADVRRGVRDRRRISRIAG